MPMGPFGPRPPLRHWQCSICGLKTTSVRNEVLCPSIKCLGVMEEHDQYWLPLDESARKVYWQATPEAADRLTQEISEYLARRDIS